MVALAIAPVFAVEAEITLVSPKQGETVSQLWPKVKEFLDMPRAERKVNGQRISKKEKNVFKISVRTNDGINAAEFCRQFGGGGHPAASGCSIEGDLGTVKKILVDAAEAYLQ